MATVINRITKTVLRSVHTPDFDPADWIINPALPEGVPPCDLVIEGDTVREMTDEEKTAVADAAAAAATIQRLARLESLRAPITDILAALTESAIERPTDFRDARTKLRAVGNRQLANTVAVDMLAARTELLELGGVWADVGAFVAAQAAGEIP